MKDYSNITNLPLPVSEDELFGLKEDGDRKVSCLSCGTHAHAKLIERQDEGIKRTLVCPKCGVEDVWNDPY